MAQISKFLRTTKVGFIHYCPACKEAHHYTVRDADPPSPYSRARWQFNGNVDRPSFSPSMKITWGRHADPNYRTDPGEEDLSGVCHYFLTDGQIIFCGDCTHGFSGKTVPLPELPPHMQGDLYGDGNP